MCSYLFSFKLYLVLPVSRRKIERENIWRMKWTAFLEHCDPSTLTEHGVYQPISCSLALSACPMKGCCRMVWRHQGQLSAPRSSSRSEGLKQLRSIRAESMDAEGCHLLLLLPPPCQSWWSRNSSPRLLSARGSLQCHQTGDSLPCQQF